MTMLRLLHAIADEIEERAAILQATEPKRAQEAQGMRTAAKIIRVAASDPDAESADAKA